MEDVVCDRIEDEFLKDYFSNVFFGLRVPNEFFLSIEEGFIIDLDENSM